MKCPICNKELVQVEIKSFLDQYVYNENSKQCNENISYIQDEERTILPHFELISEDKSIYRFSDVIASRVGSLLYISTFPFRFTQSIVVPNFPYSENFINKLKLYIKLS